MLLLIVALVFGVLAFGGRVRLEGASEVRACAEERKPDVRAYVLRPKAVENFMTGLRASESASFSRAISRPSRTSCSLSGRESPRICPSSMLMTRVE